MLTGSVDNDFLKRISKCALKRIEERNEHLLSAQRKASSGFTICQLPKGLIQGLLFHQNTVAQLIPQSCRFYTKLTLISARFAIAQISNHTGPS